MPSITGMYVCVMVWYVYITYIGEDLAERIHAEYYRYVCVCRCVCVYIHVHRGGSAEKIHAEC
jgi:hypothetical protein